MGTYLTWRTLLKGTSSWGSFKLLFKINVFHEYESCSLTLNPPFCVCPWLIVKLAALLTAYDNNYRCAYAQLTTGYLCRLCLVSTSYKARCPLVQCQCRRVVFEWCTMRISWLLQNICHCPTKPLLLQLGSASRIDGITPAALLKLLQYVKKTQSTSATLWQDSGLDMYYHEFRQNISMYDHSWIKMLFKQSFKTRLVKRGEKLRTVGGWSMLVRTVKDTITK